MEGRVPPKRRLIFKGLHGFPLGVSICSNVRVCMGAPLGVTSVFHWTVHVLGFSCAFVVADSCMRVFLLYRRRILLFHYILLHCQCQNVSDHFNVSRWEWNILMLIDAPSLHQCFFYYCYYGCTAHLLDLGRFSVSWSHTPSVGLLGRGISPLQGLCLHTEQHKHRIKAHNTDIHALSGVRTHVPRVWAGEDGSCLRPRGHCDRLVSV
jgi:hypothetical protein